MTIPVWLFPALVAVLQTLAGLVYAWQSNYRLAILWFAVAVANFSLLGAK